MDSEVCHEHTGCLARIKNVESDTTKQWLELEKMRDKVDGIMTRLNVVLGSMVIACIMLLLNVIFKSF